MNKKDIKIISHLRQDARKSLTKISRQTNIPVSTIFDKIKSYESNLILKHTALIDFNKLGYFTRAYISLKVPTEIKKDVKHYLSKRFEINSLYRINNGFDFLVEGIFKQVHDMEKFLESLETKFPSMTAESHFIIEDIKREEFMSDENLVF